MSLTPLSQHDTFAYDAAMREAARTWSHSADPLQRDANLSKIGQNLLLFVESKQGITQPSDLNALFSAFSLTAALTAPDDGLSTKRVAYHVEKILFMGLDPANMTFAGADFRRFFYAGERNAPYTDRNQRIDTAFPKDTWLPDTMTRPADDCAAFLDNRFINSLTGHVCALYASTEITHVEKHALAIATLK